MKTLKIIGIVAASIGAGVLLYKVINIASTVYAICHILNSL